MTVTSNNTSSSKVVVLVESNEDARSYLESHLSEKYTIKSFGEGFEALAYIKVEKPAIVICNMELQGMNGIELSSRLKTSYDTAITPVILYGTYDDERHRTRRMASLANVFLHTPVKVEDLKIEMEVLIRNSSFLRKAFLQRIFGEKFLETTGADAMQKKNAELVSKVTDIIVNNLEITHKPQFVIPHIAREVGMSQTSFYNKWKDITDKSPKMFVRQVQMEKARELLESGEFQVRDIPLMIGLKDNKYFRKLYKEYFGVTPQQTLMQNK